MKLAVVAGPPGDLAHVPLPLALAAGALRYANHEVAAFDLNARVRADGAGAPRSYACEILEGEPRCVGIAVEPGGEAFAFALARELKRAEPGVQLLMWGPFFRDEARAARAFAECPLDAAITGALDDVLLKLAGLYEASSRWVGLPGVWLRDGAGAKRGPKAVPFTFDLDLAPPADFAWAAPALYDRPDTMPIEGSRGCARACDFCAPREDWGKWSFKSGDRIFTDASRGLAQQPGFRRLEFLDIDANGSPESLRRFARMCAEAGWPERGIRWSMRAAIRPEMDAPLLEELAAGGCESVEYGIESGSERLRRAFGKGFSDALARAVLGATRDAGIRCEAAFFVGHPDETEEDFAATLRFLEAGRDGWDAARVREARLEEPSRLWRHGRRPDAALASRRLSAALAAARGAEAAA